MQSLRKISVRFAGIFLMVLMSCVVLFHLLVLAQVIPDNVVWGGRLEDDARMFLFEVFAIFVNLVVIAVVGMRAGYVKPVLPRKLVTVLLWMLAIVFALNTVGNLFAVTVFETVVFAPVTLISAILCCRLAIGTTPQE